AHEYDGPLWVGYRDGQHVPRSRDGVTLVRAQVNVLLPGLIVRAMRIMAISCLALGRDQLPYSSTVRSCFLSYARVTNPSASHERLPSQHGAMGGCDGACKASSAWRVQKEHPRLLGCVVRRWQENKLNQEAMQRLDRLFLLPKHIPH